MEQVAVPEKAEAAPLALPSSEVPDAPQTGGDGPFASLFSGAPLPGLLAATVCCM